jgi:thymidylate kinase
LTAIFYFVKICLTTEHSKSKSDKEEGMSVGKFIAFYSSNNRGKTSLLQELQLFLVQNDIPHFRLKYPLYGLKSSGLLINDYLRVGNPLDISPGEIQVLYSKNRIQFQPAIELLLKAGFLILAEDYSGTGLAWGLATGVSRDILEGMETEIIKPDLSFLITGQRFSSGIETAHTHECDDGLMVRAEEFHLSLAEELGWIKIVNDKPPAELSQIVWQIINQKFHIKEKE